GREVLTSIPVLPRRKEPIIDSCLPYVYRITNPEVLHILPAFFGAKLGGNLNSSGVIRPGKDSSGGHIECVVRHRVVDLFVNEGLTIPHSQLIFRFDNLRVKGRSKCYCLTSGAGFKGL